MMRHHTWQYNSNIIAITTATQYGVYVDYNNSKEIWRDSGKL